MSPNPTMTTPHESVAVDAPAMGKTVAAIRGSGRKAPTPASIGQQLCPQAFLIKMVFLTDEGAEPFSKSQKKDRAAL